MADLVQLRAEHKLLEVDLDRMLATVTDLSAESLPELRRTHESLRSRLAPHFSLEETTLFAQLRESLPDRIRKMEEQHVYIRELDGWLAELLAEADVEIDLQELRRSARQFQAMVQHHLIEEERDLFPVAARLLAEK